MVSDDGDSGSIDNAKVIILMTDVQICCTGKGKDDENDLCIDNMIIILLTA